MKPSKKQPIPTLSAVETAPDLTQEQAMKILLHQLNSTIKTCTARIEKHAEAVVKNPLHELEWSQGVFEAAADLDIATRILKSVTGGTTVMFLAEFATKEAMHGARYPQHSSSPVSNYTLTLRTAAWAKMAETLTDLAKL